jgi:hypothetical protein
MKALAKWLPEALLAALLLAAVALLSAPLRPPRRIGPSPAASAQEQPAQVQPPVPAASPKAASPAQVATLFGWAGPGASPGTPPDPPKPVEALWLKPVGFVIGEGGTPSYVFKDTKANIVLTLVPKVENKGWLLREIREKEFLLVFKGTEYVVKRND